MVLSKARKFVSIIIIYNNNNNNKKGWRVTYKHIFNN
jgi:hypothetical protein